LRRRGRTIVAAGRRLHAEWLGTPGPRLPTLVFLHEGLGCASLWKDFPEALCARLGLPGFLYDRWGYGRSAPLEGQRRPSYLHDEALTFLPEVLDRARIERPLLVGHSDGGSIALLFAAGFPSRPAAVVTIAAHVFVEAVTLAGIRDAVEAWHRTDLAARLARHHGGKAASVFWSWADTWLAPEFRDWNITGCLGRITAPTLALQGVNDQYGSPAQIEAIAAGIGRHCATALLPDCGHAPHHEVRAPTLAAIAGFAGTVLSAPGPGQDQRA
jgi:pimeloyl-ACP methyl ester carboxylesterase